MKFLIICYSFVAVCYARVTNYELFNKFSDINEVGLSEGNDGKHWALIIAGSNGWYNYRHQADACHAYHVVQKHGIQPENIVLMMYDDIAENEENPTPGIVINHPEGDDVYGGAKIDYRREDVTPENFLAIMRGDKEAMANIGSGRVIESGPNDHVFVNFVDHGAPGILGFPTEMLHVKPFIDTIQEMATDNKFKQMVMYIEACESGSMFNKLLPDNINVWATTAANPKESSYACYFDKERKTYLGDVYSVKWMEDSDEEDLSKETLHKQFKIVKQETNTSHVMQYGDTTIAKQTVDKFQGGESYVVPEPRKYPYAPLDPVASEEVPMAILRHSLQLAESEAEATNLIEKISNLKAEQKRIDQLMKSITERALADSNLWPQYVIEASLDLTEHACYMETVDHLHDNCMPVSNNGYAMKRLAVLVNLCEVGTATEKIIQAIDESCHIVTPEQ